MAASTINNKGQVTIPADVLTALGLKHGDKIKFVPTIQGQYFIAPFSTPITALKGLIPCPDNPVTIDEMNAAISTMAARAK